MRRKKLKYALSFVASIFAVVVLTTIQVFAGTNSWTVSSLSVTGEWTTTSSIFGTSDQGSVSVNGTTITATVKGSTSYTTKVTLTNNNDYTGKLLFDYATHGSYSSFSETSSSGTKVVTLNKGDSIVISIVGQDWNFDSAGFTLSNITFTELKTADATFVYDSTLGSMTAGGQPVANKGKVTGIDPSVGIAVVATPASGCTFLGWVNDSTGEVLDTKASATLVPDTTMTVRAVFINSSSTAWFLSGGMYMFNDLNVAAKKAVGMVTPVVVPMNSGTLSAGAYIIPSGVTLLIPFDDANTLYTTAPEPVNSYTTPTAYRTLTMASGAVITVEDGGAISVSGKHSSKMNSYNGSPTGKQGFIVMKEGSNITIEEGAVLYAWGYIVGEKRATNDTVPVSGTVVVETGGTVYECFQVGDYRGGNATSGMATENIFGADNIDTYHVFPMSQYYIQNVQVPMTLYNGATETGYFSVNATLVGDKSAPVPFIGSNGMFQIDSGYIIKDYDEQTDRLLIDIYGEIEMAALEISIDAGVGGMTVNIDSNDYVLPLTNNITATLHSGYVLNITQDLEILPGAKLIVDENATVNIGTSSAKKSVYVYDADEWGGYCGEYNKTIVPVSYAYDRFITRTADSLDDATVLVNGTINVTNGYAYTTSGGANIHSTSTGMVICGAAGATTTVYQATQGAGNTDITYVVVSVSPAELKNENGTYLTTTAGTYNYDHHYYCCETATCGHLHGVWFAGEHKYEKTELCACGGHAVAAIGTAYYSSLTDAVEAYGNTGYIQMVNSTTEPSIDTTYTDSDGKKQVKSIYLDLNGKNVTLQDGETTGTLTATIYGMDSTSNGYATPQGSINVTTAQPTASHNFGTTTDKHYLAIPDGTKTTFHRVAVSLTRFGVTGTNIIMEGTLRATQEAFAKLADMGFTYGTYDETAQSITGTVSTPRWGQYSTAALSDRGVYENGADTTIQYSFSVTSKNQVYEANVQAWLSGVSAPIAGTPRHISINMAGGT